MRRTRRSVLSAAGAAGATALAGCSDLTGGGATETPASNPPDGPIANAPLPNDRPQYVTMGTAGPTMTYFGSWKCPVCAEFSLGSERVLDLETIVTDYVEPGALRLRYRGVGYIDGEPFLGPDAPRATRAGLSVWNRDPERYWGYHEYVMANQPPESQQWATADRLVQFARVAGVQPLDGVREDITSGAYEDAVRANGRAFLEAFGDQRAGTPALVIDGEVHSPFRPDQTRQALDALAE